LIDKAEGQRQTETLRPKWKKNIKVNVEGEGVDIFDRIYVTLAMKNCQAF
jgi:hypothetical protein